MFGRRGKAVAWIAPRTPSSAPTPPRPESGANPPPAEEVDQLLFNSLRGDLLVFHDKVSAGGFGHARAQSWIDAIEAATTPLQLAQQLLIIEEHLEIAFLQPPLGPTRATAAKFASATKSGDDDHDTEQLEAWRKTAAATTTVAQVALLYELLHESIRWEKSCVNVKCKICRKSSDEAAMLLCDKCDAGYHMCVNLLLAGITIWSRSLH